MDTPSAVGATGDAPALVAAAPAPTATTVPASWNMPYPGYCGAEKCDRDFSQLLLRSAAAYPNARFALTSYTYEGTLPWFLGISPITYHTRLEALAPQMAATQNLRYYCQDAIGHENLCDLNHTSHGVTLRSFVKGMVTHASNWSSVSA